MRPAEILPSISLGSGDLALIDYMVVLADGRIEPPPNPDSATMQQQEAATTFRFHISHYLSRRAADWAALGQCERLAD